MNKVALVATVWAVVMVAVCYAETVKVGQRCGSCNYGSCEARDMTVSSCELFFTPCTGLLLGSFFLEPETSSSDPVLKRYNDTECKHFIGAYVLECDTCNTWDSCGMFYQVCGSSWWLWTSAVIITLCLCGCMAIGVGVFLYQLKKQAGNPSSEPSFSSYGSTGSPSYENTDSVAAASHGSTVIYQRASEAPAEEGYPAPYPYMQGGQEQASS